MSRGGIKLRVKLAWGGKVWGSTVFLERNGWGVVGGNQVYVETPTCRIARFLLRMNDCQGGSLDQLRPNL